MSKDEILGVVRHVLTIGAGYLVTHGIASTDQVQAMVGGVVAVLTIAWSIYQKRQGKA